VERSLAPSYARAVDLVTNELRGLMRLVENRGAQGNNPEGSDFEAVIEHLQPWRGRDPKLQHAHAFHIRYYFSALEKAGLHEMELNGRRYYRLAASAHYEVEHFNPHHADVESCDFCGRTGEYAAEQGNLVERVHDPLGLELATRGTIRGQPISHYTREPVTGIADSRKYRAEVTTFAPTDPQMNTQRVAVVVLRPR